MNLETGMRGDAKLVVTDADTARALGSGVVEVLGDKDRMGDARVDSVDFSWSLRQVERGVEEEIEGIAHGDFYLIIMKLGRKNSGFCLEAYGCPRLAVEAFDESGETPCAVAAHLGLASIGVVVAKTMVSSLPGCRFNGALKLLGELNPPVRAVAADWMGAAKKVAKRIEKDL